MYRHSAQRTDFGAPEPAAFALTNSQPAAIMVALVYGKTPPSSNRPSATEREGLYAILRWDVASKTSW